MTRFVLLFICIVKTVNAGVFTNGNPGNLSIVWNIPATNWPDSLWVYQVAPQNFPTPVVSNLMALGSFTEKDRTKAPSYLLGADKKAVYFGNDSKHLAICPMLGYVEYHCDRAEARMTEPVEGGPEESAVLPLALRYLHMAGIDRSLLAVRPDTGNFDLHGEKINRGYKDKTTGEWTEKVDSRGIFFLRRIDGISFRGIGLHGGVAIRFGNNSNVVDLKISWRNLVPYALLASPSQEQIGKWINSGQLKANTKDATKLTITRAAFRYDGSVGDEPMNFAFPYADCEAVAVDAHSTNTVSFQCPMTLSKDNWKVIK
jgi:hypothetical protein